MGTTRDSLIEVITSIPVDCWASGPTAAALHGFDGFVLRPPFHLTVERRHNLHRVGHHVHTTNLLDRIDRAWAHDIPVLSPARTLLHLGESETLERLTAAVDSAIRDGLVSEDFLHRRDQCPPRARTRRSPTPAALDRGRGDHPWWPELVGTRVSPCCSGVGAPSADVERVNRLQLQGYLVLQFTYPQVVGDAPWVVEAKGKAGSDLRRGRGGRALRRHGRGRRATHRVRRRRR